MRAYVPAYEMVTPGGLDEALSLLAEGWKPFAGGTDLMVLFSSGQLDHHRFVNIWDLEELRGIQVEERHVRLGALTTYAEVQSHFLLREEFPNLCRAASQSGAVAIQNRGTLGGNIVNASPAADSPPALIVYAAELELASRRGRRRVPYCGFHTGYKEMRLEPDELLLAVHLPRGKDRVHYYRKVGTRRAQAITKVGLAACGRLEEGRIMDLRLAMASVAPTVCECLRTQQLLEGRKPGQAEGGLLSQLRKAVEADIAPIDDIRSTRAYRSRVAANLVEDFWTSL